MTNPRPYGPKCPTCKRALPTKAQRAAAVARQQARRARQSRPEAGREKP